VFAKDVNTYKKQLGKFIMAEPTKGYGEHSHRDKASFFSFPPQQVPTPQTARTACISVGILTKNPSMLTFPTCSLSMADRPLSELKHGECSCNGAKSTANPEDSEGARYCSRKKRLCSKFVAQKCLKPLLSAKEGACLSAHH